MCLSLQLVIRQRGRKEEGSETARNSGQEGVCNVRKQGKRKRAGRGSRLVPIETAVRCEDGYSSVNHKASQSRKLRGSNIFWQPDGYKEH